LKQSLRGGELALLAVTLPVWLICFGLHLKQLVGEGLSWVTVTVEASAEPGGFPRVSGFWPAAESDAPGLAVGDVLRSVGGTGLAGAGPLDFAAAAQAWSGTPVPVEVARNGGAESASIHMRPVGASWRLPLLSFGFALPGFLVLWRRPGSRAARAAFLGSLCYSLHWTFFFGGPPAQTYLWILLFGLSGLALFPLILLAVLAMPEESPATTRAPLWPWVFSVYAVAAFSWVFGFPFSSAVGVRMSAAVNALAPLTMLAVVTSRYIRAGPIGRRQLRWIVYGLYVAAVPVALGGLLSTVAPTWWWLHEVLMCAVVLCPLCFFIAIVRFNFLDIDRLITATLSYSLLMAVALGLGLAMLPVVSQGLAQTTGLPESATSVAGLALLGLAVVPAHRRLRPRIDRTLFSDRYAVEQGLEEMIEELPACETRAELLQLAGETLDRLLRPEGCVIYEREGEAFQPRFVATRDESFPAIGDELLDVLTSQVRPLSAEGAGRKGDEARIHRVLERLGAAVAVAVRSSDDQVVGVLTLGRKRSGDVYTPTDLALLGRVAATMGSARV
jgi:hypothetical protein